MANSRVMINLLNTNELYGERVTTVDLKLAKNFRFRNTRATVGVDVYNLFNSDAIQDYIDTYTIDNPATAENENTCGQRFNIIPPRFARLSVQFYF
jgi:outer membrane receptor protein involved in Fe transport